MWQDPCTGCPQSLRLEVVGWGEAGSRECGWKGEMCCACWNPLVFISGLPWGAGVGALARQSRRSFQLQKPGHASEGLWSPSHRLQRPLYWMEARGRGNPGLRRSGTCPKPHAVGEVALGLDPRTLPPGLPWFMS